MAFDMLTRWDCRIFYPPYPCLQLIFRSVSEALRHIVAKAAKNISHNYQKDMATAECTSLHDSNSEGT